MEEERLEKLKKEQWEKDKAAKFETMLLFLTLDESDDGYVQIEEWIQLYKCIVLSNDKPKELEQIKKNRRGIAKGEDDEEEEEEVYDVSILESLKRAFKNNKVDNFEELGFLEFNDLIIKLNINPAKTQTKVIASRYKGCNLFCKIFKENPIHAINRKSRALEKLEFECNIS